MTWTIQGERQQGTKQFLPMTFWGGVYLSFPSLSFPPPIGYPSITCLFLNSNESSPHSDSTSLPFLVRGEQI